MPGDGFNRAYVDQLRLQKARIEYCVREKTKAVDNYHKIISNNVYASKKGDRK